MIDLHVCVGSSCHLKGSYNVIKTLERLIAEASLGSGVEMKAQFCMQQCQEAVSVAVNEKIYSVAPESAETFFQEVILKGLRAESRFSD